MIDCCPNCSLAVNVLTFVLGWYIGLYVCGNTVVYGSILSKMSALYRMLYGHCDCAVVDLLVATVCPSVWNGVCLDRSDLLYFIPWLQFLPAAIREISQNFMICLVAAHQLTVKFWAWIINCNRRDTLLMLACSYRHVCMCIYKLSGKDDNHCGHVSSRHCYMRYYVLFMPAVVGQPVILGPIHVGFSSQKRTCRPNVEVNIRPEPQMQLPSRGLFV